MKIEQAIKEYLIEIEVIHYYWMDWKKELTTAHASVPL